MKQLMRTTSAYRAAIQGLGHASLVLFEDAQYLRPLLKECAKAFFGAQDESRIANLIEEESFVDCLFLPAAGGKLTVDDAAHIIDESLLRPVEGERKLFVLDNFQDASPLVQNKLLKVLEEPPAGVYFLLGALAEHTVLPTVLSRTSKLSVVPFPEAEIYAALVREHGQSAGAREAAAASGGILSVAESLMQNGGEDFRLAEEFLSFERTEEICRALGEKKDKRAFLSALRLVLRDMLFYQTGQGKYAALGRESVKELAKGFPAGVLIAAQSAVTDAERDVRFNTNLGQSVFTLAVKIEKERALWDRVSK